MGKGIQLKGVKTHHLKNLTCEIPLHQMTVVSGVSGSGKTSLVFDTLYAEAQRRFMDSLSLQARKFTQQLPRPDVRQITGLIPAIAVTQQGSFVSYETTVGTVSNINDFLRLLFVKIGVAYCPQHHQALTKVSIQSIVETLVQRHVEQRLYILATLIREKEIVVQECIEPWIIKGYTRFRIDGVFYQRRDLPQLHSGVHTIEVVVDRMRIRADQKERLYESLELAGRIGKGRLSLWLHDQQENIMYALQEACPYCDYVAPTLDSNVFSRRHVHGMCPHCQGKGYIGQWDASHFFGHSRQTIQDHPLLRTIPRSELQSYLSTTLLQKVWRKCSEREKQVIWRGDTTFTGMLSLLQRKRKEWGQKNKKVLTLYQQKKVCEDCLGSGLQSRALSIYIHTHTKKYNYWDIQQLPIETLQSIFSQLILSKSQRAIAHVVLEEIQKRLSLLKKVGLSYISLSRTLNSLSTGEAQRVYLASRLGVGLSRLLYVLDEPSNGLHRRDQERLHVLLQQLVRQGNTIVMIDHNSYQMRHADYMIRLGPSAGEHGGEILAAGTVPRVFQQENSLIGAYVLGKKDLPVLSGKKETVDWCVLEGASGNNLKGQTVSFAIGALNVVSGVSGAGKTTLVKRTLYPILEKLYKGKSAQSPLPYRTIKGTQYWSDVVLVDSANIPKSAKITVGSYSGILQDVRDIMAQTVTARERGYGARRFSYNAMEGRCGFCAGDGVQKIRMQFLPSLYVLCRHCKGTRYNPATLEVHYQGKNIAEILAMRIQDAYAFFSAYGALQKKLQLFIDVGLGYLHLGQSTRRLSGGELQRLKLVSELLHAGQKTGLYIFDEPSMGLHVKDLRYLFVIFQKLLDAGHTIIAIDHHLDLIRQADWLIDMGPRGGVAGGYVMAMGTIADVKKVKQAPTAKYL